VRATDLPTPVRPYHLSIVTEECLVLYNFNGPASAISTPNFSVDSSSHCRLIPALRFSGLSVIAFSITIVWRYLRASATLVYFTCNPTFSSSWHMALFQCPYAVATTIPMLEILRICHLANGPGLFKGSLRSTILTIPENDIITDGAFHLEH